MTTFRNYTNGIYDTQIKCVLARYQREQAVNNAITSLKAVNKATREAKEKEITEEYRDAENEAWNEYLFSSQTAYIMYATAYQNTKSDYKSAKQTADNDYISTVLVGWNTYNNKVNNLDALFESAVAQAGDSGFNPATFFNNGTSGSQGNYQAVVNKQQALIPPGPQRPHYDSSPQGNAGMPVNVPMMDGSVRIVVAPSSGVANRMLLSSKNLGKSNVTTPLTDNQIKNLQETFKANAEIAKNFPPPDKTIIDLASSVYQFMNDNNVGTRALGGLQGLGGVLEVLGGVGLATGGGAATPASGGTSLVGVAAGWAILMHGCDDFSTGIYTIWTGESQETLTNQAVTQATGSWVLGEVVDTGIGISVLPKAGSSLAIHSMAKADGYVYVYRGMKIEEAEAIFKNGYITARGGSDAVPSALGNLMHSLTYNEGHILKYKSGYLSTTSSPFIARHFSQNSDEVITILKVKSDELISSYNPFQSEILLKNGTSVEIVNSFTSGEKIISPLHVLPNAVNNFSSGYFVVKVFYIPFVVQSSSDIP